jgi:hypothetical protein
VSWPKSAEKTPSVDKGKQEMAFELVNWNFASRRWRTGLEAFSGSPTEQDFDSGIRHHSKGILAQTRV